MHTTIIIVIIDYGFRQTHRHTIIREGREMMNLFNNKYSKKKTINTQKINFPFCYCLFDTLLIHLQDTWACCMDSAKIG